VRILEGLHFGWATETFGAAKLGDSRRSLRLVKLGARAAMNPNGKISDTFSIPAEQQGAYDFLENKHVQLSPIIAAVGASTVARCSRQQKVYSIIDGSSLGLVDGLGGKGFGSVGALVKGGVGLKVISSIAVAQDGTPIGLLDQQWWCRTKAKRRNKKQKRAENVKRSVKDKETQHWLDCMSETQNRADAMNVRLCFLLDREADNKDMLLHLSRTGHQFIVRSSWDRNVESKDGHKHLRELLREEPVYGSYWLDVASGPKRQGRSSHMVVRYSAVVLRLKEKNSGRISKMPVWAVWAREHGTTPKGEKPLDWLLFTNEPVLRMEDARNVVLGYTRRWRIEEFHKTWKSGECNVEQTQLRSSKAVMIWATVLATVALRTERLKQLSRSEPELPADSELTRYELLALLLLKREIKKQNETITDDVPPLSLAVRWIAEIGGYTGKSSGGPPGSITIRRGLERVLLVALALESYDKSSPSSTDDKNLKPKARGISK